MDLKDATIEQLEVEIQNKKDYKNSELTTKLSDCVFDIQTQFKIGVYSNEVYVEELEKVIGEFKSLMYL